MSRTKVSVKAAYWDLARTVNLEPDPAIYATGIPAGLQAQLLRCLNAGHEEAYQSNEWEDAWEDGTLTVTSNIIANSAIGDASRYTLWSADPRPTGSSAYAIPHTTSSDGIYIQDSSASVFGFWLPAPTLFTDLTSTTPVILESIAPAVVDLAAAEYYRTTDQEEKAARREASGLSRLEKRWAVEFQRVARKFWIRVYP